MNYLKLSAMTAVIFLSMGHFGKAAIPRPERRWHAAGRQAKAGCQHSKNRNGCCQQACKKKGAKKSGDLGACKEGCVFG
jgi:hypothetical protein